jgi:hypothetical protein
MNAEELVDARKRLLPKSRDFTHNAPFKAKAALAGIEHPSHPGNRQNSPFRQNKYL